MTARKTDQFITPNRLTELLLQEMGYEVEDGERRIRGGKLKDFYGWADRVGIHPDHGFLGVQATERGPLQYRVRKVLAEPRARTWIQAGGKCEVWGWGWKGSKDNKDWKLTRRRLTLDDFDAVRVV